MSGRREAAQLIARAMMRCDPADRDEAAICLVATYRSMLDHSHPDLDAEMLDAAARKFATMITEEVEALVLLHADAAGHG